MSQTAKRQQAPDGYRLRVDGHLDQRSAWFDDLTLTRESDGTTSLSGAVTDQAELHGLLMKIRDLGITLISVDVIDPPDKATPIRSGCERSRSADWWLTSGCMPYPRQDHTARRVARRDRHGAAAEQAGGADPGLGRR